MDSVWTHPTSADSSSSSSSPSSSFYSSSSSSSSVNLIKNECLNYLETTEIEYFIRTLISEVMAVNPDDPIIYASQFFRRVRFCQHVLSRDLKFIRESHYNRASFVVCIMNAFSGFLESDGAEMTIFELSSFISLLFQGISVHFVELFAAVLEPSQKHESNISLSKFYLSHLLSALYFTVMYENWLNELSAFCEIKNNRKVVDLRSILLWVGTPAYLKTRGPDKALFSNFVEDTITTRQAKGDGEISFKRLKRYIFLNDAFQRDIVDKLPNIRTDSGRKSSRQTSKLESTMVDIPARTNTMGGSFGAAEVVDGFSAVTDEKKEEVSVTMNGISSQE